MTCVAKDPKLLWCPSGAVHPTLPVRPTLPNCSEPISVGGGAELAYDDPRIAAFVEAGGCLEHLQVACEGGRRKRDPQSTDHLRMVLALLQYLGIPAMPIDGSAIALAGGWGQINLPWDDDVDLMIDIEGKQQLLGLYGASSRRQDDPAAGLVDLTGTDDATAMLREWENVPNPGVVYQIAAPKSEASGDPDNGNNLDSDWGRASKLLDSRRASVLTKHCVAIYFTVWGFFTAEVFEGCQKARGRIVVDLGYPACSGRRMDWVNQSMLAPGPGCVVAGAPSTKFGSAIPGDVEDRSANGVSKTAAIWEAQVRFARHAFATRIPAPVTLVGVSLEGLTVPRDAVADYDVYLRARYGERWNATAIICPHMIFPSFVECSESAAKIHPTAVRAAMALIPQCTTIRGLFSRLRSTRSIKCLDELGLEVKTLVDAGAISQEDILALRAVFSNQRAHLSDVGEPAAEPEPAARVCSSTI